MFFFVPNAEFHLFFCISLFFLKAVKDFFRKEYADRLLLCVSKISAVDPQKRFDKVPEDFCLQKVGTSGRGLSLKIRYLQVFLENP